MAVNDSYIPPSALNRETYSDLLDASIEEVKVRPDEYLRELEPFFFAMPVDSETFKMTTIGSVLGTPPRNDDEDDMPIAAPAPGKSKEHSVLQYRHQLRITNQLKRQDRFGRTFSMARGLPNSLNRLHELARADVLNDAFNGSTYTGADGVALCSNSHSPYNPLGADRDNLSTGALNVDNWHALRLVADSMTDERGYETPRTIKYLLTEQTNRRKAEELRGARLDPETAQNTPMVLTDWELVIVHNLSSTTAYFGAAGKAESDSGIYLFYTLLKDIADCKPSDNPDIIWAKRALTEFTVGIVEATDFIYGSAGT